jgi:hypothetical protein
MKFNDLTQLLNILDAIKYFNKLVIKQITICMNRLLIAEV